MVLAVDTFPFPATPIPTLSPIMAPFMTRFFLCAAAAAAIGVSAVIPTSAAPTSRHTNVDTVIDRLMYLVTGPIDSAFESSAFVPLIKELKKTSLPEFVTVLDDFTKDIPEAVKEVHGTAFAMAWAAFQAGQANAIITDLKAEAKDYAEYAARLLEDPAPLEGLSPAQVRYHRLFTLATAPVAALIAGGAYDPLLKALQQVDKATVVVAVEGAAAEAVSLPASIRLYPSMAQVWAAFRAGEFDAHLFPSAVKQAVRTVVHKMVARVAST